MVTELGYLPAEQEHAILQTRFPGLDEMTRRGMVNLAKLCRQAYAHGDLSTLMSLRTLISWGENRLLLEDLGISFRLSFLNRCDETERPLVAEFYQRCFATELHDAGHADSVF